MNAAPGTSSSQAAAERQVASLGRALPPGGGWGLVLALVVAVSAARLAYLWWFCPYGLVEDEAYYWLWSKHLDWSYLTKGPGVALTIAAGTLVGGDTEAGVRLTAPLWGALLAIGVAGSAGEIVAPERRARARLWGAGIALLSPPMQATSLLMTIDGPMLACWALGMWGAVRALSGRGTWAWLGLGAAIGVGLLFKPTIGLLGLGVGVALLGSGLGWWRTELAHAWRRWALAGAGLAVLGLLPVAIWNAQHEWALLRHLGEHLRAEGGTDSPGLLRRAGWMGEYLGLQALLGGPPLVLGVAAALRSRHRSSLEPDLPRGLSMLLCASLPVYLLYLAVSMATRVEGNWALGGLVPMLSLCAAGAAMGRGGLWTHGVRATVVVGVVTGLGSLRLDLFEGALGRFAPVGRLMSGPRVASGAERLADEIGPGTMLIADHYGVASQLAFYLPGRRVGCSSGASGGRTTQFDLWADTRLDRSAALGSAAVLVGGRMELWSMAFERVEERPSFQGDHRGRRVFGGWGFRGWPMMRVDPE